MYKMYAEKAAHKDGGGFIDSGGLCEARVQP